MKDTMPKVDRDATSQPLFPNSDQVPQAGSTLHQHEKGSDETTAE
jgi:hypothetical protein